jgi:sugar phosphate isomerase/epimerase
MNRREFLTRTLAASALAPALQSSAAARSGDLFKISLAEWSLHRTLFAKKLDHLDFPKVTKTEYGIDAIELVNQFFFDKAKDQEYLRDFKNRAEGEGVKIVLIMCDGIGSLGDPDQAKRKAAVEGHFPWADAAKFFGCHSIRVNADTKGQGSFEEQQQRAADGLAGLSEYCAKLGLNCIVENHGGLSSNGQWLAGVMKLVGKPNCGTLPDFGNFNLGGGKTYDPYQGVTELMPYAKAVSAKSHGFDSTGNHEGVDYRRMMKIVLDAGYHSWVGIEYEGSDLSESEGILATRDLLIKVRTELA